MHHHKFLGQSTPDHQRNHYSQHSGPYLYLTPLARRLAAENHLDYAPPCKEQAKWAYHQNG